MYRRVYNSERKLEKVCRDGYKIAVHREILVSDLYKDI